MQVALFRRRPFATAFSTAVVGFLAFAGLLFFVTLYLQDGRGLTPSQAGLFSLPLALATVVAGPISGRMTGNGHGARALVLGGIAMTAAPVLLAAVTLGDAPLGWLVVPFVLFGAGFGLLGDPINDTAVSELPPDEAGVAASLVSTAKQLGQVVGVAAVGTIVASGAADMASGVDVALGPISLLLAVCGAVVVILNARTRGRPRPSAASSSAAASHRLVRP